MIFWTIAWRVAIVAGLWLAAFASMAQTVRPEVGKPLQAAQEALNAERPADALARIAEATAVPDLTPDERYVIARLRGAAASAAGDLDTAAAAFDSALADPRMTAADRDRTLRTLTAAFYKAKRYAGAAAWGERALREQPGDRNLRVLVAQSKYLQDDWAGAAATLQVGIDEDQRAGKAPPQDVLQLLLNARFKQKDGNGVQRALEALVRHHPSPEYWADLIDQVRGQPGFAPRLALDAWRLHAQTRSLLNAEDHVEMIEASLKAGYPAEAQQVVDRGYAAGLLGKGPAAGEHQKLRERVRRLVAEDRAAAAAGRDARDPADANARAATGMNEVLNGRTERGLALLQQSLAGAGPRYPEQVRLQLGMALWWAGRKAEAIDAFKAVKGDDGSTALARLWLLLAEANTPAPPGAS